MLKLAAALAGNPCCCSVCPPANCNISYTASMWYDGASWWLNGALTIPAIPFGPDYGFEWDAVGACGPHCMSAASATSDWAYIEQVSGPSGYTAWNVYTNSDCYFNGGNFVDGTGPQWNNPYGMDWTKMLSGNNGGGGGTCDVPKSQFSFDCPNNFFLNSTPNANCTPEDPCAYVFCYGANINEPFSGSDCNPSYEAYTISWGTSSCFGTSVGDGTACCSNATYCPNGPYALYGSCLTDPGAKDSLWQGFPIMYPVNMSASGTFIISYSQASDCCCTGVRTISSPELEPSQFWLPGVTLNDTGPADAAIWLTDLPLSFTDALASDIVISPGATSMGIQWPDKVAGQLFDTRTCYKVTSGIKEYYLDGTDAQIATSQLQVDNVRHLPGIGYWDAAYLADFAFLDGGAAGQMGSRLSNGQPFENIYGDRFCHKYTFTDTQLDDTSAVPDKCAQGQLSPTYPTSFGFKKSGIAPDPLNSITFELKVNEATLSASRALVTDPWPAWSSGPVSTLLGRNLAAFHSTYGALVLPSGTLASGAQCYRIVSRTSLAITIEQWTTCGVNAVPAIIAIPPGLIP